MMHEGDGWGRYRDPSVVLTVRVIHVLSFPCSLLSRILTCLVFWSIRKALPVSAHAVSITVHSVSRKCGMGEKRAPIPRGNPPLARHQLFTWWNEIKTYVTFSLFSHIHPGPQCLPYMQLGEELQCRIEPSLCLVLLA